MKTETITSAQNPKFKNLLLLQEKSKARREQGLFVVEGRRETGHALEAGLRPKTLFLREDDLPDLEELLAAADAANPDCLAVTLPAPLYAKVAYREGTEGILAVMETRTLRLEDLVLGEAPLVVVLESVEKPGNLGVFFDTEGLINMHAEITNPGKFSVYNALCAIAVARHFGCTPEQIATCEESITGKYLKEKLNG